MTILITGATGAVGRHLVAVLLAAGEDVRAVSRDPEKAALPSGVDVVAADLADASSLDDDVFAGVDRAFVFPSDATDTFMEAAVAAGVDRFVVLSSLAAAEEFPRDHGSASQVHHAAVEAAVTSRTDRWTILRPGTFANNLLSWAYPISNGFPVRAPYVQSAQAPIHEADVADAAAAALRSEEWVGHAIAMTGPGALTRADQVAAIAAAIGRPIELVDISADEFRAETSAFIPQPIMTMLLDYWSDTLTTPDRVRPVTPLTGRPGRTLAQWARDHRADFGAA
ncbi:SDR family oxidoreductase [Microbacterium sp. ASV49]|uniref:NAD(P)H-binding protein n=1 Tax=Microbacterium candidum TaxID=3041922 RepID=A0ABT7MVK7_9MICO|nr:NAD(P)H-binding protein [Microbacterium sp. ASV49]MDL9978468.1 NAD(P)H-binding protein [Microbacterium sp. ASV49]